MKPININLVGERGGPRLGGLGGGLNLDALDLESIVPGAVAIVAAVLLAPFLSWGVDTFLINPANSHLEELHQRIGANKGKATQLAKIQKETKSLEADYNTLLSLAKQSSKWKSLLEEIRDLTPTDLWLTHMSIDKGTRLKLEGVALDYKAIAFFYTNFQNAKYFSQPLLGGLTSEETNGQSFVRFTLECDIVGGN